MKPDGSLVVLTGAGISAESGIRTFRAADGLWEEHRIEEVASPEGFARNPELVHRFYNLRRAQLSEVEPNAAHHALVRLEREWRGPFLLVTQNVDDLHDRAGSRKLIHMHGELNKARCAPCGKILEWPGDLGVEDACPACGRAGGLRPHIVWFGEMPLEMARIAGALESCDAFVAIGTSGQVHPAAAFVEWVPPRARTVEVNLEDTPRSGLFQERRSGAATLRVPELVEALLMAAPG